MLSASWQKLVLSHKPRLQFIKNITINRMLPNRSQLDLDSISNSVKVAGPVSLSDIKNSIVYADQNFCVIDKPSAVRMDGDFNVTVEKLVPHWQPSLVENNNSIKWVHQLDYATSGALCIALNGPAAAVSSKAFELRETKKVYLAVLQGHLRLDKYNYDTTDQHNEKNAAAVKSKSQEGVFNNTIMMGNFMRYYEVLAELKLCAIAAEQSSDNIDNLVNTHRYFKEYQRIRADTTMYRLFERLGRAELDTFRTEAIARQTLKKVIKFTGIPVHIEEFKRGAKIVVQSKKARKNNEVNPNTDGCEGDGDSDVDCEVGDRDDSHIIRLIEQALVPDFRYDLDHTVNATTPVVGVVVKHKIFRFKDKTSSAEVKDSISNEHKQKETAIERGEEDKLFIDIPIAGRNDDFRMEPGRLGNPGRSAQTVLQVIEYGYYQNRPVTKVRLYPSTGRRHQLRVHCLCLGHPIVGDYTYNHFHRTCVDNEAAAAAILSTTNDVDGTVGSNDTDVVDSNVLSADRMMLHAHTLMIPWPSVPPLAASQFKRDATSFINYNADSTNSIDQKDGEILVGSDTDGNSRNTITTTGNVATAEGVQDQTIDTIQSTPSQQQRNKTRDRSNGNKASKGTSRQQEPPLIDVKTKDPFIFVDSVLQL